MGVGLRLESSPVPSPDGNTRPSNHLPSPLEKTLPLLPGARQGRSRERKADRRPFPSFLSEEGSPTPLPPTAAQHQGPRGPLLGPAESPPHACGGEAYAIGGGRRRHRGDPGLALPASDSSPGGRLDRGPEAWGALRDPPSGDPALRPAPARLTSVGENGGPAAPSVATTTTLGGRGAGPQPEASRGDIRGGATTPSQLEGRSALPFLWL